MSKAKADEWLELGGGNIVVLNDETPSVEGTLRGIRPSQMYPDNKLYDLDTEDGPVAVAGSSAINARITEKEIGKDIRIEFIGMARGKSGRQYKDYKILVRGNNGGGKAAPAKGAAKAADDDELPF